MLAAIRSAAVLGIDAFDVTVEVDVVQGLPQWTLVGLPVGAVKESRERVTAALLNEGFAVPPRKVTVNLAPADVRKEGTAFDLPIALGLLVATGQLPGDAVRDLHVVGELGLDGTIRSVRGVLPMARALIGAGPVTLVIPPVNVAEARLARAVRIAAPTSLGALVAALRRGPLEEAPPVAATPEVESGLPPEDFADVVGQAAAARALEIAAAGGHNALLIGAPGAGKTMLARRLPGILPPLGEQEQLEVVAIHSVAGLLNAARASSTRPPFRAPHHTTSTAGLIGGGSVPRPGEVSLAHRGVLFLDELLEFPRFVLDALRQPLEDGHVTLARAAASVRFPARLTLIAATNPCPCGRASVGADGDAGRCRCAPTDVARYRARLSGPLADRLDLHVAVAPVPLVSLASGTRAEGSAAIRARVLHARAAQTARYASFRGLTTNADAPGRWLDSHGVIDAGARSLLVRAAETLDLSARGYHRVLRVARTIADLDGELRVAPPHVAEALRYRPAERVEPSRGLTRAATRA